MENVEMLHTIRVKIDSEDRGVSMAKCEPFTSTKETEQGPSERENHCLNSETEIRKQIITWWVECIYNDDDVTHETQQPSQ
jgi:hypothetical protein